VTDIANLGAKHKYLPTSSGKDGCLKPAFVSTKAEVVYDIAKTWSSRFAVWQQHATRLSAESSGGRVLS